MANNHSLPRRSFLRGATALVGIPLLESLNWKSTTAAPVTPPKRMVFLAMGYGVTKETWYPDRAQTGRDYELSAGLQPLSRHKQDITIIQNLQNQFSNEAHWGSTFWLTGANRYAVPGQSFNNTISADQVAAEQLGKETRFTSIQLGCDKADGHGPGLSLAWNRQGKPLAGINDPVKAFHKLFSDDKTPLAQRQALLQKRRSVLDAVLDDAKSVDKGLSKNDKDKLDEYFQSIREIELRLAKEEQWLDVPKSTPKDPVKVPQGDIAGYEEVKLMYDLMVAAMQVDATRVFSYRLPVESFIASLGATISAHNMSHYSSGQRREVSESRDRKQAELLAYLIDKLKASKEVDGSSIFDNISIAYGSNISSIHYLTNCPTVITGGGSGVKHGQHLVMKDPTTPLCNLWLSLLRGSGIDVKSHGDSTGIINELYA